MNPLHYLPLSSPELDLVNVPCSQRDEAASLPDSSCRNDDVFLLSPSSSELTPWALHLTSTDSSENHGSYVIPCSDDGGGENSADLWLSTATAKTSAPSPHAHSQCLVVADCKGNGESKKDRSSIECLSDTSVVHQIVKVEPKCK